MTEYERIRLYEIVFCNFIIELMKTNSNPIKLYDYIEATCGLIDGNKTIANSVLQTIFSNDRQYMPTKEEYLYLLVRTNLPVKKACARGHISMSTYYYYKNLTMCIRPRFKPVQTDLIISLINHMLSVTDLIERGILE